MDRLALCQVRLASDIKSEGATVLKLFRVPRVLASEVALQFRALQFLVGKSNLPVTSSHRALQYLALSTLYISNKVLASETSCSAET